MKDNIIQNQKRKSRAAFLDRDGTINVDKNYLYRIDDFEYINGAVEGMRILQKLGYLLIIVTNQSGIARGYYTEEDYHKLDEWMKNDLKMKGINIKASYYCPHLPDAPVKKYRKHCNCRKPALGLYLQAVRENNIDIKQSIAIGDRFRDLTVSFEKGCRGYLIQNNGKYGSLLEVAKDLSSKKEF